MAPTRLGRRHANRRRNPSEIDALDALDVTPAPTAVSTEPEALSLRGAAISTNRVPVKRDTGIGRAAWIGAAIALPIAAWIAQAPAESVRAESIVASVTAVAARGAAAAASFAPAASAAEAVAIEPEAVATAPAAPAEIGAAPEPVVEHRADERINRDGRHASIHGGVMFVPRDFQSADGAYDLYLHFHGNTRVVLESVEHAHINALVAIVNLGVGSAPYEDTYAMPGSYKSLLESIARGAAERGLKGGHVRRIAIGSWSAGYGALSGILQQKEGYEHLDTIISLDGIHVGYLEESPHELIKRNLLPFVNAAKAAARGELMFTITHSSVIPEGYASSTETADLLIEEAGGHRVPVDASEAPAHVDIAAAKGAVAKRLEKSLEPTTEARVGLLHVRGYRGVTPEHHMSHLLQMAATVMPELAARWERTP